jgi:filamentous hemagglutinin family protein
MKQNTHITVERAVFKHRLLCLAVASAFGGVAHANPTGPVVVNGQAAFAQQGNTLKITSSPNAIINWQSFSIGATEATRFIQQSASSAVLNRVTGIDPSVILGTLQSNGKVFLINPSGILFGQGSRIDVAGLVASTLNISNQDFLAGRLNFTAGSITAGGLVNRGTITTPSGGSVILVAPQIENSGIINAPNGDVILAAGYSVRLGDTGAPNVLVEIQAPDTQAVNVGEIVAAGGSASIYAGLIQQKGIVRADSATLDAGGRIVFKATRDVTLAAGSVTSANGQSGGQISVQAAEGTNLVYGSVIAAGLAGKGGSIQLLGNQVGVAGNARINASGTAGGGGILVGGDYKGANPDIQNARATYFGSEAIISADAIEAGDGGKIILWSDEITRAYGSISAKGGVTTGNGGFVETSSRGFLDITRSPGIGSGGTWLIDPYDIIVSSVSAQLINNSDAPNFTPTGNTSTIGANLIGGQLSTGASVTLDTSGAGSQAGNIVVQGSILTTNSVATNLTLKAHNNIYLQSGSRIESSVGALNVTLNSDQDASGAGAVSLNGASIITNGGNLVIGGGANPLTDFARSATDITFGSLNSGVAMFDSTISTGVGNITINGAANPAAGLIGDGVLVSSGATIQTTTGNVLIRGDASALSGQVNFASGVRIDFTGRILSDTGTVQLNGTGAGTLASPATSGTTGVVIQKDAVVQVTGAGHIELTGNGGASSSSTGGSVEGVMLLDRAQILADNSGTITIVGSPGTPVAGATIQNGVGFNSDGSAPGVTVRAGGTGGSIIITGLAGNGTVVENANGVAMQGAGTLVEATGAATITINGTGTNTSLVNGWAGTNGLLMFGGAQIRSAAGAITITGTGGLTTPTASGAIGVNIFDSGTAITTNHDSNYGNWRWHAGESDRADCNWRFGKRRGTDPGDWHR